MQITCPQCTHPIPAENINIQQMAAVCPNCDAVFNFKPVDASSAAKLKRRKAKKPPAVLLNESYDRMEMAFRTNFRPDKDSDLQAAAILSLVFGFFIMVFFFLYLSGENTLLPMALFSVIEAFALYNLGTNAYNRTHITVQNQQIAIERKPIPSLRPAVTFDLDLFQSFNYEETQASKDNNYDTPRFSVIGQRVDGREQVILTDLIESYAAYVTLKLEESLHDDYLLEDDARGERLEVSTNDADYDDQIVIEEQQQLGRY